jgi:hypothetical protein
MPGHGEKAKREAVIAALLCSPSYEVAAQQAGVAKSTIHRWLQSPPFRQQYDLARQQALDGVLTYLRHTMTVTVQTLFAIVQDPVSSDAAKIAAGRTLLEYAFRGIELAEITERLSRLEEHLELRKGT